METPTGHTVGRPGGECPQLFHMISPGRARPGDRSPSRMSLPDCGAAAGNPPCSLVLPTFGDNDNSLPTSSGNPSLHEQSQTCRPESPEARHRFGSQASDSGARSSVGSVEDGTLQHRDSATVPALVPPPVPPGVQMAVRPRGLAPTSPGFKTPTLGMTPLGTAPAASIGSPLVGAWHQTLASVNDNSDRPNLDGLAPLTLPNAGRPSPLAVDGALPFPKGRGSVEASPTLRGQSPTMALSSPTIAPLQPIRTPLRSPGLPPAARPPSRPVSPGLREIPPLSPARGASPGRPVPWVAGSPVAPALGCPVLSSPSTGRAVPSISLGQSPGTGRAFGLRTFSDDDDVAEGSRESPRVQLEEAVPLSARGHLDDYSTATADPPLFGLRDGTPIPGSSSFSSVSRPPLSPQPPSARSPRSLQTEDSAFVRGRSHGRRGLDVESSSDEDRGPLKTAVSALATVQRSPGSSVGASILERCKSSGAAMHGSRSHALDGSNHTADADSDSLGRVTPTPPPYQRPGRPPRLDNLSPPTVSPPPNQSTPRQATSSEASTATSVKGSPEGTPKRPVVFIVDAGTVPPRHERMSPRPRSPTHSPGSVSPSGSPVVPSAVSAGRGIAGGDLSVTSRHSPTAGSRSTSPRVNAIDTVPPQQSGSLRGVPHLGGFTRRAVGDGAPSMPDLATVSQLVASLPPGESARRVLAFNYSGGSDNVAQFPSFVRGSVLFHEQSLLKAGPAGSSSTGPPGTSAATGTTQVDTQSVWDSTRGSHGRSATGTAGRSTTGSAGRSVTSLGRSSNRSITSRRAFDQQCMAAVIAASITGFPAKSTTSTGAPTAESSSPTASLSAAAVAAAVASALPQGQPLFPKGAHGTDVVPAAPPVVRGGALVAPSSSSPMDSPRSVDGVWRPVKISSSSSPIQTSRSNMLVSSDLCDASNVAKAKPTHLSPTAHPEFLVSSDLVDVAGHEASGPQPIVNFGTDKTHSHSRDVSVGIPIVCVQDASMCADRPGAGGDEGLRPSATRFDHGAASGCLSLATQSDSVDISDMSGVPKSVMVAPSAVMAVSRRSSVATVGSMMLCPGCRGQLGASRSNNTQAPHSAEARSLKSAGSDVNGESVTLSEKTRASGVEGYCCRCGGSTTNAPPNDLATINEFGTPPWLLAQRTHAAASVLGCSPFNAGGNGGGSVPNSARLSVGGSGAQNKSVLIDLGLVLENEGDEFVFRHSFRPVNGDLASRRLAPQNLPPLPPDDESECVFERTGDVTCDEDGNMVVNGVTLWQELGAGAMGTVFLGFDQHTDEPKAVKVVQRATLEAVGTEAEADGVVQEARIMARLRHPNIVRLFACIDDPKEPAVYMVMQYVPDGVIAEVNEAGDCPTLPASEVLHYATQMADALRYTHEQGVVHGDIKPDNIFVDRAAERCFLADFGISRAEAERRATVLSLRSDDVASLEGSAALRSLHLGPGFHVEGCGPEALCTVRSPHGLPDKADWQAVSRLGVSENAPRAHSQTFFAGSLKSPALPIAGDLAPTHGASKEPDYATFETERVQLGRAASRSASPVSSAPSRSGSTASGRAAPVKKKERSNRSPTRGVDDGAHVNIPSVCVAPTTAEVHEASGRRDRLAGSAHADCSNMSASDVLSILTRHDDAASLPNATSQEPPCADPHMAREHGASRDPLSLRTSMASGQVSIEGSQQCGQRAATPALGPAASTSFPLAEPLPQHATPTSAPITPPAGETVDLSQIIGAKVTVLPEEPASPLTPWPRSDVTQSAKNTDSPPAPPAARAGSRRSEPHARTPRRQSTLRNPVASSRRSIACRSHRSMANGTALVHSILGYGSNSDVGGDVDGTRSSFPDPEPDHPVIWVGAQTPQEALRSLSCTPTSSLESESPRHHGAIETDVPGFATSQQTTMSVSAPAGAFSETASVIPHPGRRRVPAHVRARHVHSGSASGSQRSSTAGRWQDHSGSVDTPGSAASAAEIARAAVRESFVSARGGDGLMSLPASCSNTPSNPAPIDMAHLAGIGRLAMSNDLVGHEHSAEHQRSSSPPLMSLSGQPSGSNKAHLSLGSDRVRSLRTTHSTSAAVPLSPPSASPVPVRCARGSLLATAAPEAQGMPEIPSINVKTSAEALSSVFAAERAVVASRPPPLQASAGHVEAAATTENNGGSKTPPIAPPRLIDSASATPDGRGEVAHAAPVPVDDDDPSLDMSSRPLGMRKPRVMPGTPAFAAPELFNGAEPSKATDMWSLGMLLYALLFGRVPFHAATLPALCQAVCEAKLPIPADASPGATALATAVIIPLLQTRPEERMTAAHCHQALLALASFDRPMLPVTRNERVDE